MGAVVLCGGAVVVLLWPHRYIVSQSRRGAQRSVNTSTAAWLPSGYCPILSLFGLYYLDLNICAAKIVRRYQEQLSVWAGLCILISKAAITVR